MAHIRIFHPLEPLNKKLEDAGFFNGQTIGMDRIMDVVDTLFRTTNLNIMIQHHGTEDATIWVDLNGFRQR